MTVLTQEVQTKIADLFAAGKEASAIVKSVKMTKIFRDSGAELADLEAYIAELGAVKAPEAEVVPAVTEPDSGSTGGEGEETTVKAAWDAAAIAAATTTANGLTAHADANDANGGWKTATVAEADTTEHEKLYMLEDSIRAYHEMLFDLSRETQAEMMR